MTKLMLQLVDMDPDIVLPSLRFLRFQVRVTLATNTTLLYTYQQTDQIDHDLSVDGLLIVPRLPLPL